MLLFRVRHWRISKIIFIINFIITETWPREPLPHELVQTAPDRWVPKKKTPLGLSSTLPRVTEQQPGPPWVRAEFVFPSQSSSSPSMCSILILEVFWCSFKHIFTVPFQSPFWWNLFRLNFALGYTLSKHLPTLKIPYHWQPGRWSYYTPSLCNSDGWDTAWDSECGQSDNEHVLSTIVGNPWAHSRRT